MVASLARSEVDLVRVLLVDDEIRNLEALEAVLEPSGCQLVRAQSAEEALLHLLDHDFAAIVLDIKMPGMNGLELAELIKQRKRTRHVPILFLTAHLLDERDVLRGYEVGAVDYLTKPLNPEILRSKISGFVDLFHKTRALAAANDSLQREIRDRERAEEALYAANQQLELRVEERTTELRFAHDVLRASEERLRLALDAGRMGTWEVDHGSRLCRFDEVERALLGLEAGVRALTVDQFYAIVHREDLARLRDAVETPSNGADNGNGSGAFEIEFRVIRPVDGATRWHLSRGRSFTGETVDPARTLGVSFDITERKQAEELLRDADRRKNDFLATLAHELRNPLAPIRNAVQILMLKGPPHPELQWARELISRQAQQLTRLVDDLLDISRITRNKLELRREVVSLSEIVQAAVETSRPVIDEGGHELVVTQQQEPVLVDADPTRLAQVVSNLLNNAAKYSESTSTIALSIGREGSDAVVRVRDSGAGIPADMLPRIFEMFVQLDRSSSRAGGGLGVGLALARQLVEMHDGHIDVRSDGPGRGSEFIVRLPAAHTPRLDSREEVTPGHKTVETSPLRVVVADDNRDSVDSLALLLRLTGNDVREAYDGQQAVDAVRDFQPHVVLLDIGMPKLNGYEAARTIRAEAGGKHPVLVALTGWGQESDRRQSRDAGFDCHLVKPVEPNTLMKLLADIGTVAHTTPVEQHIAFPAAEGRVS
jgi:signal transduction histidine kinase/two-component SAPR family response regulator